MSRLNVVHIIADQHHAGLLGCAGDGQVLTPYLDGFAAGGVWFARAYTQNPSIRFAPWRFVHYQRATFDGEDVGELYDIDADPDETHKLYQDRDHQPIVEQGRRLLLERLIDTTRIRTASPPHSLPYIGAGTMTYAIAADGKAANTDGSARRVRTGTVNYLYGTADL